MASRSAQLADAMPNFPTNTIFIAVLGPVVEDCGPSADSLFCSDFYLVYQMFRGLGAARYFFTTISPATLLKKHGDRVVHGNPTHERVVVLDPQMAHPDLTALSNQADFRHDFVTSLTHICHDAAVNSQPVFLMLFGHGDIDTSGITLGRKRYSESRENWPKFRIQDAKKLCKENRSLQLSIMTTSCFAGPWANVVDATAMTASNEKESLSWGFSAANRFEGSPFTSAFLSVLAVDDPEDEGNEEDELAFKEFSDTMKSRLCDLTSSFGHDFHFNATQGSWDENYCHLTGIPRAEYKQRLSALGRVASLGTEKSPEHGLGALTVLDNGGPSAWELITVRTGSIRSARVALRDMSVDYLASNPGSFPRDMAVLSGARRSARGEAMDVEDEVKLWMSLSYRKRLEATTASLLYLLDLVPFPALRDWGFQEWLKEEGLGEAELKSKFMTVFNRAMPKPSQGEGTYWSKPAYYLAAACMKKSLSMEQVEERAQRTKKYIKKSTLKATDIVMGLKARPGDAAERIPNP